STVRFRSDDCWPMCSAQLRSLCPYTTLFRSEYNHGINAPLKNAIDYLHREWQYKPVGFVSYGGVSAGTRAAAAAKQVVTNLKMVDRKSTRLNSSHVKISYAVFCLKKKRSREA